MRRFLLSLAASLLPLASLTSHAVVDKNNSGVSDVAELQYNNGQPLAPNSDDDGDGLTNEQEAAAGTNPHDASPTTGKLAPLCISTLSTTSGPDENGNTVTSTTTTMHVSWPTKPGVRYRLECSTTLAPDAWQPVDDPFIGNGNLVEYTFPLAQASKTFWRVKTDYVDSDSDGVTDVEEHALGLDPQKGQTLDGFPDHWLAENFTTTLMTGGPGTVDTNADSDNDGASNTDEYLAGTDPNHTDDSSTHQWVSVHGDGPQNTAVAKTGTLKIPAGQRATLMVVIASDEFPEWTEDESEYNDLLSWNISPSQGTAITGSINVNDRHDQWQANEPKGTSLPGIPGIAHYEMVQIITAPDNQDLTLNITVSATNIADGDLPSHVAVGLLPMEIVSRDKFLAGSISIPEGWDDLALEFGGHEDLGTYGKLMQNADTKIFGSIQALLESGPDDQPADQKVWFVRDATDLRKIYFYTCYNSIGTAQIKLHLNNGNSAEPLTIPHELKAAEDFAKIIAYVDGWVKGSLFTEQGMATTWLTMTTSEIVGKIANQTRVCVIPFFDVIDQVVGFSPFALGLCDGVRMGWKDDKDFLVFLKNGAVTAHGCVVNTIETELGKWDDPVVRVTELKSILENFCNNTVLPNFSSLGDNFTSWEKFKRMSWGVWDKVVELDEFVRLVPTAALGLFISALTDWGNDFCDRMLQGAEKTAWKNIPWVNTPMLDSASAYFRISLYTFGYSFGYLAEQAVTMIIGDGVVKISQICIKSGISMVGRIAPRALASMAMRLNFVKQALIDLNLLDDDLRLAYEGMMSSAAGEATSPTIKEVSASLMEQKLAREGFDRSAFNFSEWMKSAVKDGNVRKLAKSPGGAKILQKRTSQLMHLLGDECDAATMKQFMKQAEERLIVVHADGTVDEFFEGFFRAFEGNPALMENLANPTHSIAGYSAEAKARLKQFLTDPNAGDLWKIDDPIWGPTGEPDIPHNYWTRGILAELDLYYRKYKPLGFDHLPTQAGFDYQKTAEGVVTIVQAKSVKNPDGAVNAMVKAIEKLVDKAPTNTTPLDLHIMIKPGTDKTALEAALEAYKNTDSGLSRLSITIEPYNIGPQ